MLWDINAPSHQIKLTPYSKWDSKGDQTVLNVSVSESFTNTWTSASGLWNQHEKWSLLTMPESCHHVVIPSQPSVINVDVPANQTFQIKSLNIGNNAKVMMPESSSILVEE